MGILSLGNQTLLRPGNPGTVGYDRLVVADGLFGYWPLDASTYQPVTKVEQDISRYRRNAARYSDLGNFPASVDTELGRALYFEGIQTTDASMVRLPAGGVIQGLNKASISVFYYPLAVPDNNAAILFQDTGVPGYTCMALYHTGAGALTFSARDTQTDPGFAASEATFSSNLFQWHHIVGTYNAETYLMALWRNGNLVGTNTATKGPLYDNPPAQIPVIGAYSNYDAGSVFGIYGYIRDVRVYNRDLDPDEIYELYVSGRYGMRTKYVGQTKWDLPPASVGVATSYLRPDADDNVSDWKNEADGTTNLYQSIDESTAGDTDYIKSPSPPNSSVARFRISDPAAGKTLADPVVVRYRFKKSSAADQKLDVTLKQGSTVIASWSHTGAGLTTTFQTVEQTLTAPQLASITNFNNLYIEFQASPP